MAMWPADSTEKYENPQSGWPVWTGISTTYCPNTKWDL